MFASLFCICHLCKPFTYFYRQNPPLMSERVFEGLDPEVRNRTKTMLMYFVVFAVTMLFAGFTSAYIVSNMGQFWVHVPAPSMFWTSNVMIA